MATKRSGRSLTTAERYENGQKQLAVWMPGETKDRFDALRGRTGQTSADLILRMVEAIELELAKG